MRINIDNHSHIPTISDSGCPLQDLIPILLVASYELLASLPYIIFERILRPSSTALE